MAKCAAENVTKRGKGASNKPIESYDHKDKKRANNPPVGLVTPDADPDNLESEKLTNDRSTPLVTETEGRVDRE